MAGRVQLETSGPQDAFFTDDPEYTYFINNFQKHTTFAPFFVDLDVESKVFENETHMSVVAPCINQGLRNVFN